jgi:hypothetical protein
MLQKLATHDVQDVSELFSLVDKCARAAEGHAWHSHLPQRQERPTSPKQMPLLRAVAKIET